MSRVTRTKGRYTWEHTWNTHGTHIQGEAHIGTHSEHTYTLEDVAGDTNYQGEGERALLLFNDLKIHIYICMYMYVEEEEEEDLCRG